MMNYCVTNWWAGFLLEIGMSFPASKITLITHVSYLEFVDFEFLIFLDTETLQLSDQESGYYNYIIYHGIW